MRLRIALLALVVVVPIAIGIAVQDEDPRAPRAAGRPPAVPAPRVPEVRAPPTVRASVPPKRRRPAALPSRLQSSTVGLQPIGRFHRPLYVTGAPGDTRRLFVVEKGGRVIVVRGGRQLREPFLSVRGRISDGTEQGLLGLAFAPDYARSRRLYVSYTDKRGDLRIVRYLRAKASRDRVNRTSRRLVLKVPKPRATHNGGQLVFGPDKHLYIGVGDGGGAGDPRRAGQNKATLLGKILRIDPQIDRRRNYRIPRGNPFRKTKGARDEIYALGVRNPWRFSFDRRTGAFVMGDVGQERWEEIDYRPRGRLRGANFGWSAYEGFRRFRAKARARNHVPPIHVYGRRQGCAVTGGYVVRDRALRALRGRYLYGDFCTGAIRSLRPHAPRASGVRTEHVRVPLLSSFGEDRRGRIYATSLNGPVYRLVPPRR